MRHYNRKQKETVREEQEQFLSPRQYVLAWGEILMSLKRDKEDERFWDIYLFREPYDFLSFEDYERLYAYLLHILTM